MQVLTGSALHAQCAGFALPTCFHVSVTHVSVLLQAAYCSVECQKLAWKGGHKRKCAQLAARCG